MDYAKSRKMTHDINSIAEIKKEMINIITTDELVVDSNLKNFSPAVLIVRKKEAKALERFFLDLNQDQKKRIKRGYFSTLMRLSSMKKLPGQQVYFLPIELPLIQAKKALKLLVI